MNNVLSCDFDCQLKIDNRKLNSIINSLESYICEQLETISNDFNGIYSICDSQYFDVLHKLKELRGVYTDE